MSSNNSFSKRIEEEDRKESNQIILWNDGGLFLYAYEKSAYVFCQMIKSSKVLVKEVSGMSAFIYVGVLRDKLSEYLEEKKEIVVNVHEEDGLRIIELDVSLNYSDGFDTWRAESISKFFEDKAAKDEKKRRKLAQSISERPSAHAVLSSNDVVRDCIREIKELNVAGITCIEAINILNNLHLRLVNINI